MNLDTKKKFEAYLDKRSKVPFSIEAHCFDKQIAFVRDPARFKTAVCSRRAGKTVACAAHLMFAAINKANVSCLYITLSRSNAEKIVWPDLVEINRKYRLGGKLNISKLSITFPNGSRIFVSGAKDRTEIDNFRGLALYLCYIDESQSFPPYIQNLIDEVISKALFDYAGTLCLTGTPGPVPHGYFHNCATNPKWSHHAWTMFDNPHLIAKSGKTAEVILQEELDRKGVEISNPTIQRECFGKWVMDMNVLVFQYNKDRNHYEKLPDLASPWRYIIGVDIGFEDADAIAVVAWNEKAKEAYLVDERVEDRQGITALANHLMAFIDKYRPDSVVMDTGGLGKKVAIELNQRYQLPIKAAEKTRKLEYIEILNDALRTGRFMAKHDSRFAQDSMMVKWETDIEAIEERGDRPRLKFTNEKKVISNDFHSDVCDAVLYGFREALHWLYEPPPVKIESDTPAFFSKIEKDLEEAQIERMERAKQDDPWAEAIPISEWD